MKIPTSFLSGRTALVAAALAATLSLGQAVASPRDLDGDGITNRLDPDVDGDGILNGKDRNVDGGICRKGPLKGKFVGDHLKNGTPAEKDIDGDSLPDDSKNEKDIDGDGLPDLSDDDIDGDGRANGKDDDCDGDGRGRAKDDDDDGDGTDDSADSDDDNDKIGDDDENEVERPLAPTPDAPAGSRVRAKVKLSPGGKIELEFDGRNLAAGDYDVVVDGQILGTLTMTAGKDRTEGEVHFETSPNKDGELPLPFNPFGLPVLIVKTGTTYFSGTVPTPSDVFTDADDDDHDGKRIMIPLIPSVSLPPGNIVVGEGHVEVQFGPDSVIGPDGVIGLEVEIAGLPAGIYDFKVGGTVRGTISVVLVKNKLKGKLRYELEPDGDGELLLDFEIFKRLILISQGKTIFLSGGVPAI